MGFRESGPWALSPYPDQEGPSFDDSPKIPISGIPLARTAQFPMLLKYNSRPCRHGTTSEPILNQHYLFRAEPILNESWTNSEPILNQSYWFARSPFGYGSYFFVRPPFGYGSLKYIPTCSHFGSAELILNQKYLQGRAPLKINPQKILKIVLLLESVQVSFFVLCCNDW